MNGLPHPVFLRRAEWRHWVLGVTFVLFLAVFSTALTHIHKDAKAELDCPVCHVVGHQSLDMPSPTLAAGGGLVLWFILSLPLLSPGVIHVRPERSPPSRAPPGF